MYQPSTSEIDTDAAPPERETVIKFVISGPFLNAEAAHTQWSTEPPPGSAAGSVMQDLVRRIAELERKLDEERALVERLSRQLPATAPEAEPAAAPSDHVPLVEPAPPRAVEPAPPRAVEPVPPRAVEAVAAPVPRTIAAPAARAAEALAEPAPRTIAAPAPPPPLSTVARTPPPKVRGLRRMIGALRHL